MGGAIGDLFGGGKTKTNFNDLERFFKLQDEMSQKDQHGLFSSKVWRDGAQYHEVDPALEAGKNSLMERMSSPYEGYSSPSGLQGLLDSRMKHQYERMNMQAPQPELGQPGGMPGSQGPSQLPAQPAQPQPMPPGGQGPMPPGAGPGPQPGQGQLPQQGQMGPPGPGQGQMGPPRPQGPAWANKQRFGGPAGMIEAGIDTAARNRAGDGDRESVMKNMFSALMGG